MTVTVAGGDPAPIVTDTSPNLIENDNPTVLMTINGSLMRHGSSLVLRKSGETDISALSVDWIDFNLVHGTFYIRGRAGGFWDLLVTNPDGQEVVFPDALWLTQIVAAKLQSASVTAVEGGLQIRLEIRDFQSEETLIVRRSSTGEGPWFDLDGAFQEIQPGIFVYVDRQVEPGKIYYYKLDVKDGEGNVSELYKGSGVLPAGKLVLEQNYPNPFNPSTRIYFYLPERVPVKLAIYDVSGRHIKTLAKGVFRAGPYTLSWNGDNRFGERVGTGVYIYKLTAGRETMSRKMLLMK